MSSDGAIDKPRSVRPARGDDRGLAGIALGALLLLSLIATVVMVFSDNPVWMRIGTLSALWAAFIGAFLVARYRRQAATEAARVRDLHTVYELQLEREISARREHELVVEKDLRDTVRAETSDSLQSLRREIAALREQLGEMGVTLSDDRLAVGADTTAGELGAGSSLPSVRSERVEPRRRTPESSSSAQSDPSTTSPDPSAASGPVRTRQSAPEPTVTGVGRNVTPSTERTEKFSPVDAGAAGSAPMSTDRARSATPQGDYLRGPAVRPAGRSQPERTTQPEPTSQPETTARPESTTKPEPTTKPEARPESRNEPEAPRPSRSASEPPSKGAAATSAPDSSTPPPASAPHSRHGEGGGLSVAELMARLGGDDAPGGGRRHRHSAD